MKIKVITDKSMEGMQIKEALENNKIQDKIGNSFVIRWGEWIEGKDDGIILNSSQSIKNTLDKEVLILTLTKNKVNCPKRIKPGKKTEFPIIGRKYEHRGGSDIKVIDSFDEYKRCDCDYFLQILQIVEEFKVHVMDLETFFIEEKYQEYIAEMEEPIIRSKPFGWQLRKIHLSQWNEEEQKEMTNLAVRAVYALGLDFGVVNVGKTSEGKYMVLDVDGVPGKMSMECREAYIEQFEKTLLKYDGLINDPGDVTIGADPECIIRDKNNGSILFASDFFSKEGPYGLDARTVESGNRYHPLVEIRPDYSTNPIKVVKSIETIITNMYQHIHYKNIGLYAGSMPVYNYWVGGHVHFGIKPNSKLIKALDNYLALPLLMIEKNYSARERKKAYGILGNFRLKSHGGFEYCTLSSWLVTPEITAGVVCLSKVIAQEYLNLKEEFLWDYSDIRAFYLVNKSYFMDKIKKIINHIKSTTTYRQYQSSIDPLLQQISLCEEWPEDRDVKETWGLISSNEIYKVTWKCFIPKEKRQEFDIQLGDKINLLIGKEKYEAEVGPKDDLTIEKEGYVSFSEDICKKIGLRETESVGIWFDNKDKGYRIGPILGIFTDRVNHDFGPFGEQTFYLRKLLKLSQNKGMITYIFTIWDADWNNNRIKGYEYDFDNDQWLKRYFPIPDIIYDRADVVNEQNYGQYAKIYIDYIKKSNIKFINSLECIGTTNNKWETYKLLKSTDEVNIYLPYTCEYEGNRHLQQCIKEYSHVYLKQKEGSRSRGIFSIERIDDDHYEIHHKNSNYENEQLTVRRIDVIPTIETKIRKAVCLKSEYIIQQAVDVAQYRGNNFEIRVIMQKNSQGMWFRTCMIGRIVGNNEKFIDAWNEEDVRFMDVLTECFRENATEIANKIRRISKNVVSVMDSNGLQVGELSIDFTIDHNMNIYIIELNSKPDNLLSKIGAFRMKNLAVNRILEYAKFLVLN